MGVRVAVVFGTRPEAIKVAPVIQQLKQRQERIQPLLISTGQHRGLLDQVLHAFHIQADVDLDIMTQGQSPSQVTRLILEKLEPVLIAFRPDLVLVQGDTISTLAGALGAFFNGSKVGHIESGLRSFNKFRPYPEEMNRKLVSLLTDFHFAPTASAKENLLNEGVPSSQIYVTGNPVVDALQQISRSYNLARLEEVQGVDLSRRVFLVTSHRRENWGKPLEHICDALVRVAAAHPNVEVVFPAHPNPQVQEIVHRKLGGKDRIHVTAPLPYPAFIALMSRCYLVLTDSGGTQEEAPCLGKPVLVLRTETERIESCAAGAARVVGTDPEKIVQEVTYLLEHEEAYREMSVVRTLYGDGNAAERITEIILQHFQ